VEPVGEHVPAREAVQRYELVTSYGVTSVAIVSTDLLRAALRTFNFKIKPCQDDGALD
jgi:hypothetical protein